MVLFVLLFWATPVAAEGLRAANFTADAAILVEASTGRVLFEKNADKRKNPASTTKITTLLLALENGNLEDLVDIPAGLPAEGATIHLAAGDRIRLRELLSGMMLASGNDAAAAVASHLAGSTEAFAERMNEFAARIGAYNTHFVNANGLTVLGHYTTARDLSKLAAYGYRQSEFRRLVALKSMDVQWQQPAGKHFVFENTNELLGRYPGVNGIKTGYTAAAGECLVASAERDGVALIAVVLQAGQNRRFTEAAALLEDGFGRVKMEHAYQRDEIVQEIRVHGGREYKVTVRPQQDILYPVLAGDQDSYSVHVAAPRYVSAPVKAGMQIGCVEILYGGKVVNRIPLLADADIERGFSLLSFLSVIYDGIYDSLRLG